MGECGLPKLMAAELYRHSLFVSSLSGYPKTVKSAKKIVDRRDL